MKTYYLYIFTSIKGDRYATVSVGKKLSQNQINVLKSDIADVEDCDETRTFGINYKHLELNGDQLDEWFELEENENVYVMFPVDEDDETETFEKDS